MSKINFVFFGTSEEAVYALQALHKKEIAPSLIVTAPDKPAGRHYKLTAPLAKKWALEHSIPVFQPEKTNAEAIEIIKEIRADVFVVVGYGKILPQALIDLPKHKTLNVHPSLLPLYRGPTPIEGPILAGDIETGVSIIVVDQEVDHGPIVLQEKHMLTGKETTPELTKKLFTRGGELLAEILPEWINGKINPKEQDQSKATFTKKLKKEDGLVDLENEAPQVLYNKFRAYCAWPRIFFFRNNKRVIITDATLENGEFKIKKVLPEGKREISFEEFTRSQ